MASLISVSLLGRSRAECCGETVRKASQKARNSVSVGRNPDAISPVRHATRAALRLPPGSRVLHAELVWGGTFAGNTAADDVSAFINDPIAFTTPRGTFDVTPDPATGRTDGTVAGTGTCNGCFYVRTADVTASVAAAGPGFYAAGRVPADVDEP